jgi:hypothetical protein
MLHRLKLLSFRRLPRSWDTTELTVFPPFHLRTETDTVPETLYCVQNTTENPAAATKGYNTTARTIQNWFMLLSIACLKYLWGGVIPRAGNRTRPPVGWFWFQSWRNGLLQPEDDALSKCILDIVQTDTVYMRWAGRACSTNGAKRNAYRILVGMPEGKKPLGRPRRRWVDNIKMNLRMGWYGVAWSGSG